MQTKIFFTTLFLFVGLVTNAQINKNTSNYGETKEQREERKKKCN